MALRCSKCRHRDASVVAGSDEVGRWRTVTCRACGHQATQRAYLEVNLFDAEAGRPFERWCWPDGTREPAGLPEPVPNPPPDANPDAPSASPGPGPDIPERP